MSELSKVLTGCALGAVSFVALMLNVSVLTVIIGGKFLKENSPTVYIITFLNVIGDAMQVGLILIYLTPASIAQVRVCHSGPFKPSLFRVGYFPMGPTGQVRRHSRTYSRYSGISVC